MDKKVNNVYSGNKMETKEPPQENKKKENARARQLHYGRWLTNRIQCGNIVVYTFIPGIPSIHGECKKRIEKNYVRTISKDKKNQDQ
jgi:hypothetical protein